MIKLRSANKNDISFCLSIRNDKKNHKYFYSTKKITKKEQKIFIEKEKYFYIIEKDKKKIGTISLYNIENKMAEWGRFFVLEEYRNSLIPIIAEIKLLQIGFDIVDLMYCNTKINNINVWKMHEKIGFKTIFKTGENILQEIRREYFTPFTNKVIQKYLC